MSNEKITIVDTTCSKTKCPAYEAGCDLPPEHCPQQTYRIVRKYKDTTHPDHNKEIDSGLTRFDAAKHCNDPDSHEPGVWFDAFYEE